MRRDEKGFERVFFGDFFFCRDLPCKLKESFGALEISLDTRRAEKSMTMEEKRDAVSKRNSCLM